LANLYEQQTYTIIFKQLMLQQQMTRISAIADMANDWDGDVILKPFSRNDC